MMPLRENNLLHRERERGGDRETGRERQTDRDTDRQRQTDREPEREREQLILPVFPPPYKVTWQPATKNKSTSRH